MKIDPDIPKSLQLFTADQSREIDNKTIEEFGIDGFTLMELAAKGAAEIIQSKTGPDKHGFFICGKGNNAGDALASARYLLENFRHRVSIHFTLGSEDLSPDCEKNLNLLKKLAEHSTSILFVDNVTNEFQECDYIVDGIFGTGLNSEVRSPAKEIIEQINNSGKSVFSMDLPSGLNADTGIIHGVAVSANHTCTFGTQKIGLYLNDGPKISGDIAFIDLPFPSYLRKNYVTGIDERLSSILPKIKRVAKHKYESGVIHIVAGSKGLTGAAIMAAKSAWKQGAGSVILYAPEDLLPIYETVLPNIIKVVLPDSESYQPDHAKIILNKISEKPGVLLIGPGIGTTDQTREFVNLLLGNYSGPAVIDADALASWDQIKDLPANKKMNWVLTPHPGEVKNYLNITTPDSNPITATSEFSKKQGISILLKGNPSIYIPFKGSPFMTVYNTTPFTRAGFGDILCGTISAYWGITKSIEWSPVYALLHGYIKYKNKPESIDSFGPEDFT